LHTRHLLLQQLLLLCRRLGMITCSCQFELQLLCAVAVELCKPFLEA
jgi:hypothetical protein